MSALLVRSQQYLQPLAILITIGIAVVLLVYTMGPADGTWVLYGREILSGRKLYSELGITAQPVMPLIGSIIVKAFGSDFIPGKLVFVPLIIIYVWLLSRAVSHIETSVIKRAVLIFSLFFIGIHFEAYRFDDYHAVANIGILSGILLSMGEIKSPRKKYELLMGVVSALTFLTRVNEGLVMLACGLALTFVRPSVSNYVRCSRIFVLMTTFSLIVFFVLYLVGENISAWYFATIANASGAKGGIGHLVLAPISLVTKSIRYVFENITSNIYLLVYFFGFVIMSFGALIKKSKRFNLIISALGVVLLLLAGRRTDLIAFSSASMVVVLFLMFLYMLATALVGSSGYRLKLYNKNLLIIYPVGLYAFGALSSGGHFFGLYFPLSIAILYVIYANSSVMCNQLILAFIIVLGVSGTNFRINNPYSWHSYHLESILSDQYVAEVNNALGFHIVTKELKGLVVPVCDAINRDPGSLLSIPWSFANYYCGISPWGGYVQTFFDTTPHWKIVKLIEELNKAPPKYIFYQRQLDNLRGHEIVFNHGTRLPQRDLDELIFSQVKSGRWSVVYYSNAYSPSEWFLINTEN